MESNVIMISEEKWALLTDELLQDFRDELDANFQLVKSKKPTYWNFYFFKTGSAGFYHSLETACEKNNSIDFYTYLTRTPWHDTGIIDDLILIEMHRRGIIVEGDEEDIEKYFDYEFVKDTESL